MVSVFSTLSSALLVSVTGKLGVFWWGGAKLKALQPLGGVGGSSPPKGRCHVLGVGGFYVTCWAPPPGTNLRNSLAYIPQMVVRSETRIFGAQAVRSGSSSYIRSRSARARNGERGRSFGLGNPVALHNK